MATITPVEDRGNLSEPLLVTGDPVVMSDPVASATTDLESDTMPLPDRVWRDGLFGCFKNCCSPVFLLWLGWCCNPILLVLAAETMTRMRLNPEDYTHTFKTVFVDWVFVFLAILTRIYVAFEAYSFSVPLAHTMTMMRLDPCGSTGGKYKKIFKTMFVFFLVVLTFSIASDAHTLFTLKTMSNDPSTAFWVFYYVGATINFVFAIYVLVIGIRTCSAIHQKSNIPVGKCKGAEDCCCVFLCGCSSAQQLPRHTADYETYDTEWCSTPVQMPARPTSREVAVVF